MKKAVFIPVLILAAALLSFIPKKNKKRSAVKKTYSSVPVKKKNMADSSENTYSIVIKKKEYELKVYDSDGWYATYPIVFGSKDLGDKMKEGDKRTPNGTYRVILKKIHPKWGPELLLDFPNPSDIAKFNERKRRGVIPKSARIGGGIAIHATRPGEEWTVDNFYNWTDGCISVKYTEMKDLFSYISVGTVVTIEQ